MAVSQRLAGEIFVKCARHCCICRRFRPLHLQVHHIVEQSDGGNDELDNLIALCVSCHCDVHTDTKLTRRFTTQELKLHRNNVYQMVADGMLSASNESPDQTTVLSASIVQALRALGSQPSPIHPQLPPESIEILLAAVRANTPIIMVQYDGGRAVLVGEQTFGERYDRRSSAKYKNAVDQLYSHSLVAGAADSLDVTHAGYLLADDVLAAGAAGKNA